MGSWSSARGGMLAAMGALALVIATAPPASATFDAGGGGDSAGARAGDGFQIEEISAFTLRAEELKVGPTAIRYGLFGELQVGTSFALNLLGAINADLKWRVYRSEVFALGVDSGVLYFDPGALGVADTDFQITAVPLKLDASFLVSDVLRLHLRASALLGAADRQAPDLALRLQRHLGPVGRLAAELYVEWRASPHFAVVVDYALPLVMHPAELLYAGESPDDRAAMMRVAASLLGTFDSFNFRVGLGYGPSLLGEQGVFPVIDLYWRIY